MASREASNVPKIYLIEICKIKSELKSLACNQFLVFQHYTPPVFFCFF